MGKVGCQGEIIDPFNLLRSITDKWYEKQIFTKIPRDIQRFIDDDNVLHTDALFLADRGDAELPGVITETASRTALYLVFSSRILLLILISNHALLSGKGTK
jgi:hypothetical protein